MAAVSNIENLISIPGKGLQGTLAGVEIKGGNSTWLELQNEPTIIRMHHAGLTMFSVAMSGKFVAAFGVKDSVREDVKPIVRRLLLEGKDVYIVSGDAWPVVSAVAFELDVPQTQAKASCLPQDKLAHIKDLQAQGRKVMFVGDGTNDTLAIAQADVGIALASKDDRSKSASVVAASAADILLFSPSSLLHVFHLSRGAANRIYINFVWSFIYNLIAILGACGALAAVNVVIAPEYAGLGEMVSVLPVIVIAWSMWLLKK
jgi:Cd2+-exporting ATPase